MTPSDVCAATTALFTCHGGDGSLSPETASVLFFEMGQGTSQLLPVRLAPNDVSFFLPEGDEAPDDTGCQALRGTAGLFYCAGVDGEQGKQVNYGRRGIGAIHEANGLPYQQFLQ